MTFGSTPKLKTPVKRRNDVTVRTPASNKKKRIGTVPSTPTNNGRSLCNPRYNTPGFHIVLFYFMLFVIFFYPKETDD